MPTIYSVPFMIAKTYTIHVTVVRVLFYSIVYPDKGNFERLAIYPTLTLVERLPDDLIGTIDHEIAHIIALKGKVNIPKSDIHSILGNKEDNVKVKEKKAEADYKYFNEPALSVIIKWDRVSMQKGIEEIVSKDVQPISQQQFDRIVFQENLNHFHAFIKSKLSESE